MDFVIGIDGGGTKTAAVILNRQGQVLGYGTSGPSTYGVVPAAAAQASIAGAAQAAAGMAGLEPSTCEAAFIGLGNVVSEVDRSAVRELALAIGLTRNGQIGVDHDIRIALAGGLSGRPGIVVIAGTGTSCFGINSAGESWRSGGWGPLIDDDGSSYWLGIQAMRAAVMNYDGRGEHTQLTQFICERLGLAQMDDLMNRLYTDKMTRTKIAALAPLVFDSAAQGDAAARGLIRSGCAAMADSALAVARKIGLDVGASELAITGGLTNAGEALLAPFREAIEERLPECQVKKAELIPAVGAALLALEMIGKQLDEALIAAVKKNVREFGLIG